MSKNTPTSKPSIAFCEKSLESNLRTNICSLHNGYSIRIDIDSEDIEDGFKSWVSVSYDTADFHVRRSGSVLTEVYNGELVHLLDTLIL